MYMNYLKKKAAEGGALGDYDGPVITPEALEYVQRLENYAPVDPQKPTETIQRLVGYNPLISLEAKAAVPLVMGLLEDQRQFEEIGLAPVSYATPVYGAAPVNGAATPEVDAAPVDDAATPEVHPSEEPEAFESYTNNPTVANIMATAGDVKDWIKANPATAALLGIGGLGLGYGLYNWMSDDDDEDED